VNDPSAALAIVDPAAILALGPPTIAPDLDGIADPRLPPDHPPWQRDVISLSSRTRALIATIVPAVVRTFSYWDHRIRELALGTRTLAVDPAGCYRLK
jgi:hypothetical protein